MRLFIAICLDNKIKTSILKLQSQINIEHLNPKWIEPKDCHITLKFLGDVKKENVLKVIDVCKDIVSKYKPFSISFGKLGGFPNPSIPRIIFLELKNKGFLSDIAHSLEEGLFKIGFEKEKRPFTPHLTIARIKYPQKTELLFPYLSKEFIEEKMDVKGVSLIESNLTSSGPIYTILETFSL